MGRRGHTWAHLGTNQGNTNELHGMLLRRSQQFRRPDLGYAEGSNPSATAKAVLTFTQLEEISKFAAGAQGRRWLDTGDCWFAAARVSHRRGEFTPLRSGRRAP